MTAVTELNRVSVTRGGRLVLDNLSLALEAGERLAIVGANGAGKSTLLRTIVGLESASGTVTVLGERCAREADFRRIRGRVAYLFQDPDDQLFCPTVIEDVIFGPLNLGMRRQDAISLGHALLRDLGLSHLAERLTHHLSGGEKRLVSLAAVLAMRPQVLLLDEPTNALDETRLRVMLEILSRQSAAMIVVSHDLPILQRLTDRTAILRDGRLVPATLHRHPRWIDQVHLHDLG